MAKVANPRFATLKYLAIFSIFGDFLLRSYINSLMIFENGPIFVSTESVLRKFAQTLKKKGNEWAKIQLFFAPFIYKFLNDFRKSSNFCVDGERPPKNCLNIKGFILHFDENVQKMTDFHQNVM